MRKNRVGLLGGTFNPIHLGHIDLGRQIREAFHLDKILYILSAQPPHKKEMNVVPPELRWKMLQEALSPFPELEPCDIEMKRPTWSWTIDTVNQLIEENPNTDFFFISGSEGFLKIKTWKEYKALLATLSFIIVLRVPDHKDAVTALLNEENLEPRLETPGPDAPEAQQSEKGFYLYTYSSDKLFISSTLIRKKVQAAEPVDELVDEKVKHIMEEYNLYEL